MRASPSPVFADLAHLRLDEVGVAHEARRPCGRGPLVDLARGADLFDPPLAHERDALRHRHGLVLVMRDDEEREPEIALHLHQLELRFLAQLAIERGERFVEQQQARTRRQRAGQRDARLLPARQLIGPPPAETLHLHEAQASRARARRSRPTPCPAGAG